GAAAPRLPSIALLAISDGTTRGEESDVLRLSRADRIRARISASTPAAGPYCWTHGRRGPGGVTHGCTGSETGSGSVCRDARGARGRTASRPFTSWYIRRLASAGTFAFWP